MNNRDSKRIPKYLGGIPTESRGFKEYVKDIIKKIRNYFKWK